METSAREDLVHQLRQYLAPVTRTCYLESRSPALEPDASRDSKDGARIIAPSGTRKSSCDVSTQSKLSRCCARSFAELEMPCTMLCPNPQFQLETRLKMDLRTAEINNEQNTAVREREIVNRLANEAQGIPRAGRDNMLGRTSTCCSTKRLSNTFSAATVSERVQSAQAELRLQT